MNLRDKTELLKKALENRNTPPDANEVWGNVEHRLSMKRRRKKKLLFSCLALLVLASFYSLLINLGPYHSKSGNNISKPSEMMQNKPGQLQAERKKTAPLAVNDNPDHSSSQARTVPNFNETLPGKSLLKTRKYKAISRKEPRESVPVNSDFMAIAERDDKAHFEDNGSVPEPESTDQVGSSNSQEENIPAITEKDQSAQTAPDSTENKLKKNEDKNQKDDSIPKKPKKFIVRPYLGIVLNQLKPFSVPGKSGTYSLLSNYSGGLLLDYCINPKAMLTFNFGYIKLPSKIELLKKDMSSGNQIIRVLNTNNLITGLELSQFNLRKNICYNIGAQVAISGNKRNYVEQVNNNTSIFYKQKELPQNLRNHYFAKVDLLFNMGLSFYHHRSIFRINYYQGLTDVSRTTRLFNPHAFFQLGYAYQLFRF